MELDTYASVDQRYDDPHSDIGIELPFDVVLQYVFSDGSVREYRFIGKADGYMIETTRYICTKTKLLQDLMKHGRNHSSFPLRSQDIVSPSRLWAGRSIENAEIYGMCSTATKEL
jgi:hypothetical protein